MGDSVAGAAKEEAGLAVGAAKEAGGLAVGLEAVGLGKVVSEAEVRVVEAGLGAVAMAGVEDSGEAA